MTIVAKYVAEAIATDHDARVNFDAIVKSGARIQRYPRMQPAILADTCPPADETKCVHGGAATYLDLVFDHDVGAHTDVRREPRRRRDNCRRMNFRTQRRLRHKPSGRLRERKLGVRDL